MALSTDSESEKCKALRLSCVAICASCSESSLWRAFVFWRTETPVAFDVADAGRRVGKGDIVVEGGSEGDSRRLSVVGNGIGDGTGSSPWGNEAPVSGGEGSGLCGTSGIGMCGNNGSGRVGTGVTR